MIKEGGSFTYILIAILIMGAVYFVLGSVINVGYAKFNLNLVDKVEGTFQMMDGNKWRLFCLDFSFIGWDILCSFTLGIGYLWLTPYKQTARAAFYREVSGTEKPDFESEWN